MALPITSSMLIHSLQSASHVQVLRSRACWLWLELVYESHRRTGKEL